MADQGEECDFCRWTSEVTLTKFWPGVEPMHLCELCRRSVTEGMVTGQSVDHGVRELARQANYNAHWLAAQLRRIEPTR